MKKELFILTTLLLSLLVISSVSAVSICSGVNGACVQATNLTFTPPTPNNREDVTLSGACLNTGQDPTGIQVDVYVNNVLTTSNVIADPTASTMYDVVTLSRREIEVDDVVLATLKCYWGTVGQYHSVSDAVVVESAMKNNQPPENEELLWFYYEPTDTNISIEFLNRHNISGQTTPIQSPIGLKTEVDSLVVNQGNLKWSYELLLPNPEWIAVNRIRTNQGVYESGSQYGFQVGAIGTIDYTDAVLEGFNVSVVVNDGIQNISGNLTYNASLNYADVIMWKDYQGASKLYIDPEVCVPNWQPSTYDTCQINDSQQATGYVDENNCGLEYNGTYDWYSCDYCTPDWSCSAWSTTNCTDNTYDCESLTDSNSCYATTGLATDLFWGDITDYNQGYCNTYESEDMSNIVIDFLAKYGIQLTAFAGVIALLGLVILAKKKGLWKRK